MRTLCLSLQQHPNPSIAENFLTFSPKVHFREPGLVFIDISNTSSFFGGEQKLANEALHLSHEFFPLSTAAIADSPSAAQVFSSRQQLYIAPPTEEQEQLNQLPLETLTQLEGLVAWSSPREVEDIISFFQTLGLKHIGDLQNFEIESFRERWGQTGSLLWKRLHGLDRQVISPLQPSELLTEYVYLDYPVSLVSFLLHCLEKNLRILFSRLHGRGEFVQKVNLHLFCEYSDKCHLIELTPANPNRNLELFLKLLENKLVDLDLDNPIREFELEVISCPEKIQQLDFFEPQERSSDKLHQLMSLFNQASIHTGYFRPCNEMLPENSWSVNSNFESYSALTDHVEIEELDEVKRQAFQIKPAYSKQLSHAPRPSRLLDKPRPLTEGQLKQLHFLSQHPIERLEDSWWEDSRGRDYFFAVSTKGQNLWVFYDRIEDQYYLHGYFD